MIKIKSTCKFYMYFFYVWQWNKVQKRFIYSFLLYLICIKFSFMKQKGPVT